jgi:Uma2 family endonuclease
MGAPARQLDVRYTYSDYLTWDDGKRWEIINGEVWDMSPAPTLKHQNISRNIFYRFIRHFEGKECIPYDAPTDVVLDEDNVVQPDLLVVCDRSKLTDACVRGTPELIVEILSPSTGLKDRREKKALYERFGVREFILIDPANEIVERYTLRDGRYGSPDVFGWNESMSLTLFPELELNLWEIFDKERITTVNEPPARYPRHYRQS